MNRLTNPYLRLISLLSFSSSSSSSSPSPLSSGVWLSELPEIPESLILFPSSLSSTLLWIIWNVLLSAITNAVCRQILFPFLLSHFWCIFLLFFWPLCMHLLLLTLSSQGFHFTFFSITNIFLFSIRICEIWIWI